MDQRDFYDTTHGSFEDTINVPENCTCETLPVLLNAGQVSFHHKLTFHGSYPNTPGRLRRNIAIHLRTEKSWPKKGQESVFTSDLDDYDLNPAVFGL